MSSARTDILVTTITSSRERAAHLSWTGSSRQDRTVQRSLVESGDRQNSVSCGYYKSRSGEQAVETGSDPFARQEHIWTSFAGVFRWRKRGSAAPDPCASAGYSSGRIDQPAVLPVGKCCAPA